MEGLGQRLGVLVHNEGDSVGVAIRDLEPEDVEASWLDTGRRQSVRVSRSIPLGHKVALVDLAEDVDVIEYGVRIAMTRHAIESGDWVHTHNIRSARWPQIA